MCDRNTIEHFSTKTVGPQILKACSIESCRNCFLFHFKDKLLMFIKFYVTGQKIIESRIFQIRLKFHQNSHKFCPKKELSKISVLFSINCFISFSLFKLFAQPIVLITKIVNNFNKLLPLAVFI